jgi:hypothetical protein
MLASMELLSFVVYELMPLEIVFPGKATIAFFAMPGCVVIQ